MNLPGGNQGFEAGPRIENSKESHNVVSFEEPDDFIIGIRVKILYYKRWFIFSKPKDLMDETYLKGATMHGEENEKERPAR